jgi:hypothetical protein
MIKAGCFFSAIIFRPTIVFPEPGGATITPKSFLAIVSITAFWCSWSCALNKKETSFNFFLSSLKSYSILFSLQNRIIFPIKPLGMMT